MNNVIVVLFGVLLFGCGGPEQKVVPGISIEFSSDQLEKFEKESARGVFKSGSYIDTVKVKRVDNGVSIKFKKTHFYKRAYGVTMKPVTEKTIKEQYTYILADVLHHKRPDVEVAEVGIGNLSSETMFIEERVDKSFIEKRGVSSSLVVRSSLARGASIKTKDERTKALVSDKVSFLDRMIDSGNFEFARDFIDYRQAAEVAALSYVEHGKMTGVDFYYCYTNGKLFPIYRAGVTKGGGLLQKLLLDEKFKAEVADVIGRLKMNLHDVEQQINAFIGQAGVKGSMFEKVSMNFINQLAHLELKSEGENVALLEWNAPTVVSPIYEGNTDTLISLVTAIGFERTENKLVIPDGSEIHVSGKLMIPPGFTLEVGKGVTFLMADSASLLSYSPFNINGTKDAPVIIKAENEVFNTFAYVGDNTAHCTINWLQVENGREERMHGIYLSGMFCIYHADVTMNHAEFKGGKADDGVNIKFGNVTINHAKFYENFADQVDLDFCTGTVDSCMFDNNAGDSNGDGLDFSGSKVTVSNSTFSAFSDKGISVGEQSIISVNRCTFTDNKQGIAVKDLSVVDIEGCSFTNNKKVAKCYQKKQMFGGGTLNVKEGNSFSGNVLKYSTDKQSIVNE